MRSIILWGTGFCAEKLWKYMTENAESHEDKVIGFCDNSVAKQGSKFCGIEVIAPEKVKKVEFDFLVLANTFEKEIRTQIEENNLCSLDKVWTLEEYNRQLYAKKQYFKRYGFRHNEASDSKQEGKSIVYTALIGDYDILEDPDFVSDEIDYVCFTNNRKMRSKIWNIEYLKDDSLSDVMLARKIKMFPQIYLNESGIVYWVDAKCRILSDLREYKRKYWGNSGFLLFPHYERNCICDETAELISYKNKDKRDFILQTAVYLNEGYPVDYGLYDTACIVRDTNNLDVRKLMSLWWDELVKYSYRDQLSLPYVCWKYNFCPDICDLYIYKNSWLQVKAHKKVC